MKRTTVLKISIIAPAILTAIVSIINFVSLPLDSAILSIFAMIVLSPVIGFLIHEIVNHYYELDKLDKKDEQTRSEEIRKELEKLLGEKL